MTQRRRRGLNPGWLLTVARSAAIARVGAYYSLIVLVLYDACGRSPDLRSTSAPGTTMQTNDPHPPAHTRVQYPTRVQWHVVHGLHNTTKT